MDTSELIGAELDAAVAWAVGICEGQPNESKAKYWSVIPDELSPTGKQMIVPSAFRPSTNWSQGGPIIEKEQIALSFYSEEIGWAAFIFDPDEQEPYKDYFGPTPLIAAMRAFVASKQ